MWVLSVVTYDNKPKIDIFENKNITDIKLENISKYDSVLFFETYKEASDFALVLYDKYLDRVEELQKEIAKIVVTIGKNLKSVKRTFERSKKIKKDKC